MTETPAERAEQRASDQDRDVVAGDLRDAFSEGRLDTDEYQRRLDAVWESRTYGELDRLTVDLPEPLQRIEAAAEEERAKAVEEKKKREMADYLGEWKSWIGGSLIMLGIWGVTSIASGEVNRFWPAIPIGIWAIVLLVGALGGSRTPRRLHGSRNLRHRSLMLERRWARRRRP